MFSIEDIKESDLDMQANELIQAYCLDETVHSHHLLTYAELLMYVWARIMAHEHKSELIKILGEQVMDSRGLCFTGRFNRTLSVLVGFYEDIIISISDNSRISAIIIKARDKCNVSPSRDSTVPYSPEAHAELAKTMLLEAGYDLAEVNVWLEAIHTD